MTSVLGIELPTEWQSGRLKDCTSFLNRGTAPDYADDGPVRAISQAANQSGGLDWSRTRFHAYSGDPAKLRGHLLEGDILVNSTGTGTLGRIGYFERSPDNLACMADGHITLARTRPDVLWPRFGYYWLSSRPFQDLISAVLSIGATNQIELSRERLSEAPVPLPPIEEQRRIADFLDTAAQTIERIAMMRRANLRLNAERRRAVLHTELSGDTIRGLKVRHPVLGLLPATWRLAPLKWIVSSMGVGVVVNPSSYFADEGVPFLHGSNVLDGEFALDNVRRMSEADSARLRRSRLNAGDVVVVRAGDPGRAAVVPVELHGANCASIIILRRSPAVESDYLAAYFNSPLGRAYVDVTRYGAAQEQINLSHVADFVVPLPEIQTQKAIVNTINQMEDDFRDLQSKISRQLTLFTEQLNALITAAVTGQIDVTTARGLRCRESGAFGVGV